MGPLDNHYIRHLLEIPRDGLEVHEVAEAASSALTTQVTWRTCQERETRRVKLKFAATCLVGLDLPPLLSSELPSVSLWRGRDKAREMRGGMCT